MLTIIALIVSIILQFVATVFAIRLIKVTKYNISWILISIGLMIMAARRLFEFFTYVNRDLSDAMLTLNNWLGVLISILLVIGIFYIGKIFIYLKRMEELRQQSEKRILGAIIFTEENERKRFAKDLHDGLGPLLSSVKMSVSSLSSGNEKEPRKAIYNNAMQAVNESINSLKEISNNLSPHILDHFGLAKAIRSFTSKIEQVGKVRIDFRTNLKDGRFDSQVEVILYRAVCELVNNTLKHADAGKVLISLDQENNMLKVLYQDDGKGFDFEKAMLQENGGMGLHNIQSRIASINGTFRCESWPGEGIIVTIAVKI
nr:sensor histidine kinase [Bacteroidota bacterium]